MTAKQVKKPAVQLAIPGKTLNGVTHQLMAQAFEAWERDYRLNHDAFRTPSECICLGVSEVSQERADYFFELMRVVSNVDFAASL